MNTRYISQAVFALTLFLFSNTSLLYAQVGAEILIAQFEQLPEDATWQTRSNLLEKISGAYESSPFWARAKRSVDYRKQLAELFEAHLEDDSSPQFGRQKNQFMLRFFTELEEKPASDAEEIWKHVQQRHKIPGLMKKHQFKAIIRLTQAQKAFFLETFGEDSYWTAIAAAHEVRANMYRMKVPDDSEAVVKKAIQISSREKGKYTKEVVELHKLLVAVFNSQRRFSESAALLENCQPIADAVYGADHQQALELKTVRSNCLLTDGQVNEARETLYEIVDRVGTPEDKDQAVMFAEINLSLINLEVTAGNYEKALTVCESFYAERERYSKYDPGRDWLARNLMYRIDLLMTIRDQGKLREAAREISNHIPDIKSASVKVRSKLLLAIALIRLQDLDLAEQYLREIQFAPEQAAAASNVEPYLARISRLKGDYDEAVKLYQGRLETYATEKRSDYEGIILWRELGITYRLMEDHKNALSCFEKCFELELAEQHRKNEQLSRIEQRANAIQMYDYYSLLLQALQNNAKELDVKLAFERLLAIQSGCENASSFTLEQYLKQVPPGSAIVQFVTRTIDHPDPANEFVQEFRYGAFVIQRADEQSKATVSWFDIGKSNEITMSQQKWAKAIEKCMPSGTDRGIRAAREAKTGAAESLGESFQQHLRPILATLSKDTKQVVICPTGSLWGVPWNCIRTQPKGTYLIESCQVSVEASCSNALNNLLARHDNSTSERKMTLVYDLDFGVAKPETPSFLQLPATNKEAKKVIQDWGDSQIDSYSGRDAKRESIIQSLKTSNVAYFATHVHSEFQSNQVVKSPNNLILDLVLQKYQQDLNALRFQSIVLSSANQSLETGLLQAAEIAELDLKHMDLAVLSCCSSASGASVKGLGNCGVQRAFHMAGCKTVIGSLWPVEDEATQKLMHDFSRHHFLEGRPANESLRLAILNQMKSQPFHRWAGWMVLGE